MIWTRTNTSGKPRYVAKNGRGFVAFVTDHGTHFDVTSTRGHRTVEVPGNSLDTLKLAVFDMANNEALSFEVTS